MICYSLIRDLKHQRGDNKLQKTRIEEINTILYCQGLEEIFVLEN